MDEQLINHLALLDSSLVLFHFITNKGYYKTRLIVLRPNKEIEAQVQCCSVQIELQR